jgi:hypothetical protein
MNEILVFGGNKRSNPKRDMLDVQVLDQKCTVDWGISSSWAVDA